MVASTHNLKDHSIITGCEILFTLDYFKCTFIEIAMISHHGLYCNLLFAWYIVTHQCTRSLVIPYLFKGTALKQMFCRTSSPKSVAHIFICTLSKNARDEYEIYPLAYIFIKNISY